MAYIIYNNDGTVLLTLAEGEIDSVTTTLDLVGKNVNNYGQYVNNNFTKLLTSFASPNPPLSPQPGQLWYNTSESRLKVYNGAEFKPTYGATAAGTEPVTTSSGDIWFDTINRQMNIWYDPPGNTSGYWLLVGPATSYTDGKFGVEPPPIDILDNSFDQKKNVGVLYSYGTPHALITTSSFTMSASSSTVYFNSNTTTNIVNGITVISNLDVRGDLYVGGRIKSDKTLTISYDVSLWTDPTSPSASEAERQTGLDQSNAYIVSNVLNYVFPNTSTYYLENSEVRVLTTFNSSTYRSTVVRHFRLEEYIPGTLDWRPYNLYSSAYITSTLTNMISAAIRTF